MIRKTIPLNFGDSRHEFGGFGNCFCFFRDLGTDDDTASQLRKAESVARGWADSIETIGSWEYVNKGRGDLATGKKCLLATDEHTVIEAPTRPMLYSAADGAWRSPGAHLHGVQGVGGSNPLAPTIFFPFDNTASWHQFAFPSRLAGHSGQPLSFSLWIMLAADCR